MTSNVTPLVSVASGAAAAAVAGAAAASGLPTGPPDPRSDASAWRNRPDLATQSKDLPSPTAPYDVAVELSQGWTYDGAPTRIYWDETWWQWATSHWVRWHPDDRAAWMWRTLSQCSFWKVDPQGARIRAPWNPNLTAVANVTAALQAVQYLGEDLPCPGWTDGRPVTPDDLWVACNNGLLNTPTRTLFPFDPRFYNHFAVPFDYDPDAPRPERFLRFLQEAWPDDPDAQRLVVEWFAYVVSGRTDLQTIFLLIGPPGSGKGTLVRLLTALIGARNVTTTSFRDLMGSFGLQSFVEGGLKTLAVLTDAHVLRGDTTEAVEHMNQIAGEDQKTIQRKFKTDMHVTKMPTRLMILSNEVPNFKDPSGSFAKRLKILRMTRGYRGTGEEDLYLLRDMLVELPGIFNLVLDALDDLDERGQFAEPESSQGVRTALVGATQPFVEFAEHEGLCTLGPELSVEKVELWEAYNDWRREQGKPAISNSRFGVDLRAAYPGVSERFEGSSRAGTRKRLYVGITLTSSLYQS